MICNLLHSTRFYLDIFSFFEFACAADDLQPWILLLDEAHRVQLVDGIALWIVMNRAPQHRRLPAPINLSARGLLVACPLPHRPTAAYCCLSMRSDICVPFSNRCAQSMPPARRFHSQLAIFIVCSFPEFGSPPINVMPLNAVTILSVKPFFAFASNTSLTQFVGPWAGIEIQIKSNQTWEISINFKWWSI